jgi:hypothetical protein
MQLGNSLLVIAYVLLKIEVSLTFSKITMFSIHRACFFGTTVRATTTLPVYARNLAEVAHLF